MMNKDVLLKGVDYIEYLLDYIESMLIDFK